MDNAQNHLQEFIHGTGRTRLRLRVLGMGEDLCLLLDGGDRPHTGAVAVAHSGAEQARSLSLPGHREEELACRLAAKVHQRCRVTVTLLCGVHIDNITREEIALVLAEAEALIAEWLATLPHSPKDIPC